MAADATFSFSTNIEQVVAEITKGLSAIQSRINSNTKGASASQLSNLPREMAEVVRQAGVQLERLNAAFKQNPANAQHLAADYQKAINSLNHDLGRLASGRGVNITVGASLAAEAVDKVVAQLNAELSRARTSGINVGAANVSNKNQSFSGGYTSGQDTAYAQNIAAAAKARAREEREAKKSAAAAAATATANQQAAADAKSTADKLKSAGERQVAAAERSASANERKATADEKAATNAQRAKPPVSDTSRDLGDVRKKLRGRFGPDETKTVPPAAPAATPPTPPTPPAPPVDTARQQQEQADSQRRAAQAAQAQAEQAERTVNQLRPNYEAAARHGREWVDAAARTPRAQQRLNAILEAQVRDEERRAQTRGPIALPAEAPRPAGAPIVVPGTRAITAGGEPAQASLGLGTTLAKLPSLANEYVKILSDVIAQIREQHRIYSLITSTARDAYTAWRAYAEALARMPAAIEGLRPAAQLAIESGLLRGQRALGQRSTTTTAPPRPTPTRADADAEKAAADAARAYAATAENARRAADQARQEAEALRASAAASQASATAARQAADASQRTAQARLKEAQEAEKAATATQGSAPKRLTQADILARLSPDARERLGGSLDGAGFGSFTSSKKYPELHRLFGIDPDAPRPQGTYRTPLDFAKARYPDYQTPFQYRNLPGRSDLTGSTPGSYSIKKTAELGARVGRELEEIERLLREEKQQVGQGNAATAQAAQAAQAKAAAARQAAEQAQREADALRASANAIEAEARRRTAAADAAATAKRAAEAAETEAIRRSAQARTQATTGTPAAPRPIPQPSAQESQGSALALIRTLASEIAVRSRPGELARSGATTVTANVQDLKPPIAAGPRGRTELELFDPAKYLREQAEREALKGANRMSEAMRRLFDLTGGTFKKTADDVLPIGAQHLARIRGDVTDIFHVTRDGAFQIKRFSAEYFKLFAKLERDSLADLRRVQAQTASAATQTIPGARYNPSLRPPAAGAAAGAGGAGTPGGRGNGRGGSGTGGGPNGNIGGPGNPNFNSQGANNYAGALGNAARQAQHLTVSQRALQSFLRGIASGSGGSFAEATTRAEKFTAALIGVAHAAGTTLKYGALGSGLYFLQDALGQAVAEVLDFEDSVTEMEISLESVNPDLRLSNTALTGLSDSAAAAGANVGQSMDLAAAAVRAFSDETDGSQESIDRLQVNFAAAATTLATISKTDITDAAGNLRAIGQAFDIPDTSFQRVNDILAGAKAIGGGTEKEIGQGLANLGVQFKELGFSAEETATIISKVQSETDQSGTLIASRLTRATAILGGTAGKAAVAKLNRGLAPEAQINTAASTRDQILQLSAVYKNLGQAQKQLLVNQLGGATAARELIILLDNAEDIVEKVDKGFTGKGAEEYAKRLADIRGVLQQIQGNLKGIVTAFANSGALDPLFALTQYALLPALEAARKLLEAFNLIPRPVRTILFLIGEIYLAMKLIKALAGLNPFRGMATSAAQAANSAQAAAAATKAAAATPARQGFFARAQQAFSPKAAPVAAAPLTGAQKLAARQAAAAAGASTGRVYAPTARAQASLVPGGGMRFAYPSAVGRPVTPRQQFLDRSGNVPRLNPAYRVVSLSERTRAAGRGIQAAGNLSQTRVTPQLIRTGFGQAVTGIKNLGSTVKSGFNSFRAGGARFAQFQAGGGYRGNFQAGYQNALAAGTSRRYAALQGVGASIGSRLPAPVAAGASRIGGAARQVGGLVGPEGLAVAGILAAVTANQKTREILSNADATAKLRQEAVSGTGDTTALKDAANNLKSAADELERSSSGFIGGTVNNIMKLVGDNSADQEVEAARELGASYERAAQIIAEAQAKARQAGDVASQIDTSNTENLTASLQNLADAGYTATEIVDGMTQRITQMADAIVTGTVKLTETQATTIAAASGSRAAKDAADLKDVRRYRNDKGQIASSTEAKRYENLDPEAVQLATTTISRDFLTQGVTLQNGTNTNDLNNNEAMQILIARYKKQYQEQFGYSDKDAQDAAVVAASDLRNKANEISGGALKDSLVGFFSDLVGQLSGVSTEAITEAVKYGETGDGKGGVKSKALIGLEAQQKVLQENIREGQKALAALAGKTDEQSLADAETIRQGLKQAGVALDQVNQQAANEVVANMRANFELLQASQPPENTLKNLEALGKELQDELAATDDPDEQRRIKGEIAKNNTAIAQQRVKDKNARDRAAVDSRDEVGVAESDLRAANNTLADLNARKVDKNSEEYQNALKEQKDAEQNVAKVRADRAIALRNADANADDSLDAAKRALADDETLLGTMLVGSTEYANQQAKIAADRRALAKKQTEADIAARNTNVLASSSLDTATRQLADATDQLNNYAKDTLEYNQQLAQVNAAQIAVANAAAEAASVTRQLALDLTNPVQVAREGVITAREKLANVRAEAAKSNATPEAKAQAIGAAQLELRTAENNAAAAEFSQFLQATNTANDLGRISHRAYLGLLRGRRDQLAAELAQLDPRSNGYKQIQDQIDQLDQAIKAGAEELSGQFNIGDIRVPTPYEVRRAIKERNAGTVLANNGASSVAGNVTNDNSSKSVVLNGVPIQTVMAMIEDLFGVKGRSTGGRKRV